MLDLNQKGNELQTSEHTFQLMCFLKSVQAKPGTFQLTQSRSRASRCASFPRRVSEAACTQQLTPMWGADCSSPAARYCHSSSTHEAWKSAILLSELCTCFQFYSQNISPSLTKQMWHSFPPQLFLTGANKFKRVKRWAGRRKQRGKVQMRVAGFGSSKNLLSMNVSTK